MQTRQRCDDKATNAELLVEQAIQQRKKSLSPLRATEGRGGMPTLRLLISSHVPASEHDRVSVSQPDRCSKHRTMRAS
jgi:hypothetical protein